ncbi:MAG: hypothetical protein Q9219_000279 [cf. Caloplaca sp. 3 TL-2023]
MNRDLGLLVGLEVILGFCASHAVHRQLLAVRKACEITQPKSSDETSAKKTEDAIKLETLDELSKNANQDIRNAAIKIIVDRACKSQACHLVLNDLSIPHCFDPFKYTALQSVITCLSYQLPLSYNYEIGKKNGKVIQRTQPERDALELFKNFLARYGVSLAMECNVFSLWFAKYPYAGDLEAERPGDESSQSTAKARSIEEMSMDVGLGDEAMTRIVNLLLNNTEAREYMIQHGLWGQHNNYPNNPTKNDEKDAEDEYSKIWGEIHGLSTAPEMGLGPMMRRGMRARDESWEEQTLRRRRREAMVLGEMGRPIEREDIIQRVYM